jgi:GDP-L-fucose synthase
MISIISRYKGEVKWNTEVSDGTYQKMLSVSKLNNLGWKSRITLNEGLKSTYDWFVENYANTRLNVPVNLTM